MNILNHKIFSIIEEALDIKSTFYSSNVGFTSLSITLKMNNLFFIIEYVHISFLSYHINFRLSQKKIMTMTPTFTKYPLGKLDELNGTKHLNYPIYV